MMSSPFLKNHFPIGKYCANESNGVYAKKKPILIDDSAENTHS
jgi:hypothetical protein